MSQAVFVTATGTNVGKTYISALLVKTLRQRGFNAGYYKPALSGAQVINGELVPGDAKFVCDMAGLKRSPRDLVSYVYQTPVAPHLAARHEGNPLEMDVVRRDFAALILQYDFVVVEGAGGLVCPLRHDAEKQVYLADVIKALDLPVVIVADAGLGAINGSALTVAYARNLDIDVKGIILNRYQAVDFLHADNKNHVEHLTKVPVVACVGDNDTELDMDTARLLTLF